MGLILGALLLTRPEEEGGEESGRCAYGTMEWFKAKVGRGNKKIIQPPSRRPKNANPTNPAAAATTPVITPTASPPPPPTSSPPPPPGDHPSEDTTKTPSPLPSAPRKAPPLSTPTKKATALMVRPSSTAKHTSLPYNKPIARRAKPKPKAVAGLSAVTVQKL